MDFDKAVAELDTLVATLERDEDERALLLLQLIDAIHRPALELIVAGEADHPRARALMMMYDLLPADELIQVEEALDEIRPYIESHGGGIEVLDVQDGVVHVQMHGSCNGCAASAMTLRRGVEEKLRERLEWFSEVVAHEPEPDEDESAGSGIALPVLQIEHRENGTSTATNLLQIDNLRKPVFVEAGRLEDLSPGASKAVDVEGKSILILNIDGEPYAFKNLCPVGGGRLPLDGGRVTGTVLVCPWHNCAYDARTGRRADDEPDAPSLAVVPIAVSEGVLKVAANVA